MTQYIQKLLVIIMISSIYNSNSVFAGSGVNSTIPTSSNSDGISDNTNTILDAANATVETNFNATELFQFMSSEVGKLVKTCNSTESECLQGVEILDIDSTSSSLQSDSTSYTMDSVMTSLTDFCASSRYVESPCEAHVRHLGSVIKGNHARKAYCDPNYNAAVQNVYSTCKGNDYHRAGVCKITEED
jgi:hypothetical protein